MNDDLSLAALRSDLDELYATTDPLAVDRAKSLVIGQKGGETAQTIWDILEAKRAAKKRVRGFGDSYSQLVTHLLAYDDGDIDGFELLGVDPEMLATARADVNAYRRQNRPLITVDHTLADSHAEIAAALRGLADAFDAETPAALLDDAAIDAMDDHHSDRVYATRPVCCTRSYTQGPARWKKGSEGEILVQTHCTLTTCIFDNCQSRYGCPIIDPNNKESFTLVQAKSRTEVCDEKVLWRRASGEEPPQGSTLPNFSPIAWNGCLPFYADNSDAQLTSLFGWRRSRIGTGNEYHGGIDVHAPQGTQVRAVRAGTVLEARTIPRDGQGDSEVGIIVTTDQGQDTYWHVVSPLVRAGDQITVGTPLGTLFEWAAPSRRHLHFVRRNSAGERLNPLDGCNFR